VAIYHYITEPIAIEAIVVLVVLVLRMDNLSPHLLVCKKMPLEISIQILNYFNCILSAFVAYTIVVLHTAKEHWVKL
jgi:hypothetical protein